MGVRVVVHEGNRLPVKDLGPPGQSGRARLAGRASGEMRGSLGKTRPAGVDGFWCVPGAGAVGFVGGGEGSGCEGRLPVSAVVTWCLPGPAGACVRWGPPPRPVYRHHARRALCCGHLGGCLLLLPQDCVPACHRQPRTALSPHESRLLSASDPAFAFPQTFSLEKLGRVGLPGVHVSLHMPYRWSSAHDSPGLWPPCPERRSCAHRTTALCHAPT